jgi:hypothetical protein
MVERMAHEGRSETEIRAAIRAAERALEQERQDEATIAVVEPTYRLP